MSFYLHEAPNLSVFCTGLHISTKEKRSKALSVKSYTPWLFPYDYWFYDTSSIFAHLHNLSKCPRGVWTWPQWVICAPAFNHKLGNAVYSGVSEIFFPTNFRSFADLQRCANSRPPDPNTTEIITSWCGLTMFWLCSVISLQQFLRRRFRNMLRE